MGLLGGELFDLCFVLVLGGGEGEKGRKIGKKKREKKRKKEKEKENGKRKTHSSLIGV